MRNPDLVSFLENMTLPNTLGAFSKLTCHDYCWEILMCSLSNVHICNVK